MLFTTQPQPVIQCRAADRVLGRWCGAVLHHCTLWALCTAGGFWKTGKLLGERHEVGEFRPWMAGKSPKYMEIHLQGSSETLERTITTYKEASNCKTTSPGQDIWTSFNLQAYFHNQCKIQKQKPVALSTFVAMSQVHLVLFGAHWFESLTNPSHALLDE